MTAAEAVLAAGVAAALGLAGFNLLRQRDLERRLARRTVPAAGSTPQGALQRVGVVRFNPYHDTGGDYSFAVALLDLGGNGVVMTGLYHRDRCRVYAKAVTAWDSQHALTDEERAAIEQARH